MPRYTFEFLSVYDGISHYRLFRDGRDDGKIYVRHVNSKMTYADGSPVLKSEVEAFNVMRQAEHAKAVAKHGVELVGEFKEYSA